MYKTDDNVKVSEEIEESGVNHSTKKRLADDRPESDALSISSRIKKSPEIPQIERRNWLIHLHYIRNEYEKCKQLITAQLDETQGTCEYALFTQGLILRQEGKLQESLELFQTCSVLSPTNLENVKQVARSLFLLGKAQAAAELYEEATKIDSNSWDLWQNLGECYQILGNLEKAKECVNQALQLSKREETFLLLGYIHSSQKDYKNAVDVYSKALQNYPESASIHAEMGLMFLTMGSQRRAFEHIGTALAFDPSHSKALMAAGTILQSNGDFDVALSKYRPIASAAPDTAPLWNNIGMCFFGRKKYVACIGCLKRAQYLAPMEWITLYNLGLVHLTMQQYASAFHFLSAAINLQPTAGKTFMLLAVALTYLLDMDNAKLAYEQAIELDSTDPTFCLNFAVFLFNRGEYLLSSQQLGNFERRTARFGQNPSVGIDQEHLELANSLGSALASMENVDPRSRSNHDTTVH